MSETALEEKTENRAESRGTWRSDPRVTRVVNHLLHLAETRDSRAESRAALAELRQGISSPLRAARHIAPFLGPPDKIRDDEHVFYMVAGLFAIHQKHQEGVSLGKAFRRIKDGSSSIEKRFFALLAADADHLEDSLRHAVRLLASNDVPLDWYRLTEDLLGWESPDRKVQMRLAREFYYTGGDTDTTDTTNNTNTTPSATAQGEE